MRIMVQWIGWIGLVFQFGCASKASCDGDELANLQEQCLSYGGTFSASTDANDAQACEGEVTPVSGEAACRLESSGGCAILCSFPNDTGTTTAQTQYQEISSGNYATSALTLDGTPQVWGDIDASFLPTHGGYQQISTCGAAICALNASSEVECWGDSTLAIVTDVPSGTFAEVACGDATACAIDDNGQIVCWGEGSGYDENFPPSGSGYTGLSIGYGVGCAIDRNGMSDCWGHMWSNVDEINGIEASMVDVGDVGACVLDVFFDLHCSSWDEYPEISRPPNQSQVSVSCGGLHCCALNASGATSCWGVEEQGNTLVGPEETFEQISAGDYHTCALDASGVASCWGANGAGQASPP